VTSFSVLGAMKEEVRSTATYKRGRMRTILVAIIVSSFINQSLGQSTNAPQKLQECMPLHDSLIKLEHATIDLLAKITQRRHEAEQRGALLGSEQFEPFIAALKNQETELASQLVWIRRMPCFNIK
jgi:hypothetical protein